MLVSISCVSNIVQDFLQQNVIPKAPNPLMQFGLGFITPYIPDAITNYINDNLKTLKMIGVIDQHNRIDVDKAKMAACKAIDNVNGKLNVYGYMIDKSDVDSMYNIAQKYQISTEVPPKTEQSITQPST